MKARLCVLVYSAQRELGTVAYYGLELPFLPVSGMEILLDPDPDPGHDYPGVCEVAGLSFWHPEQLLFVEGIDCNSDDLEGTLEELLTDFRAFGWKINDPKPFNYVDRPRHLRLVADPDSQEDP